MNYGKLNTIAGKAGNSFYIFDRKRLEDNYLCFRNAFQQIYPPTAVAYAYKANYAPFAVKTIDHLGGMAEVVSTMEYDIALKAGVSPERIIFNGPVKSPQDISRALQQGAILNLDSHYELDIIKQLNHQNDTFRKRSKGVGLRINFPLPGKEKSRFGFDTGILPEIRNKIAELKNTYLRGIHCHFSTRDKSPANYRLIAEELIRQAEILFPDSQPEYIDTGGGFFGNMPEELKMNFNVPIPPPEKYAEALAGTFSRHYGNRGPQLIIEPGVSLIADAMQFVARVIDIKKIQDSWLAITSGSTHHVKPTGGKSLQPFKVVSQHPDQPERELKITGHTCMEADILHAGFKGKLGKGDFLVYPNKGAYTIVFKPQFIHYAPPVVEIDESGEPVFLRQAETIDDILSTYRL
ncbi:decarboxylase [Thermodesulfobacteriota bacterium]